MASAMRSMAFGASVSRACVPRTVFRPAMAPASRASTVVVRAAEEDDKKKGPKKRTPAPVKRAQLAEERRMYNKARKSACATRVKKVLKMAEKLMAAQATEEDVKGMEKLVSEAYKEVDKAISKGVLHINNGARKKARVAYWKRQVLLNAGMWVPPADHADYSKYQKMQAKKATA